VHDGAAILGNPHHGRVQGHDIDEVHRSGRRLGTMDDGAVDPWHLVILSG
ncbi:uncharacterized protein METZ01_LOCUS232274, partial [marine metagenome]